MAIQAVDGVPADALEMLRQDHRHIERCFRKYELEEAESEWSELVDATLTALKIHMEVEEDIVYPAYLAATNDVDRHHDGMIEHEGIKKLIDDIEHSDPGDEYFDAMMRVLARMVRAHVGEEEGPGGLLDGVRRTELNLVALGARIVERREDLSEVISPHRHGPHGWPKPSQPGK